MEHDVHLGEKIRTIRQMKGMKQSTLAKGLGIVQQNVSKMEQKKDIPEERLERAAQILGITVEELKNYDHKGSVTNNFCDQHVTNYNFNPIEKIIELYDALLESKNEVLEAKEQIIRELREKH